MPSTLLSLSSSNLSEAMSEYIFEKQGENKERDRFLMLEAAFDAATCQKLQKTGIRGDWHCLE